MVKPPRLTQSVLNRSFYLQLLTVQDGSNRLVAQHQIGGNLGDGKFAAGVRRVHQQEICDTTQTP